MYTGKAILSDDISSIHLCDDAAGKCPNTMRKTYKENERLVDAKERVLAGTFLREAGIYSRLGNQIPGICEVREIGEGYLTLENYSETLANSLDPDGKRSTNKDMRYYALEDSLIPIAKLLTAVHMMHQKGVANLDLTPQNILYEQMDTESLGEDGPFLTKDKLVICNFGKGVVYAKEELQHIQQLRKLVKEVIQRGGDISPLLYNIRPVDSLMYSPYAPPENYVAVPSGAILVPESDIWSVGAIFYEMLTGYRFNSLVIKDKGAGKIYIKNNNFEDMSGPFDFFMTVTQDMKQEGFAIYDKRWIQHRNNKKLKPGISYLSPLFVLENAQEKLRGPFEEDQRTMIFDLMRGMLDPNPLTRYTALDCLKSPLFDPVREHIQDISKSPIGNIIDPSESESGLEIPLVLRYMYIFAGKYQLKDSAGCKPMEKLYIIYSTLFSAYPRLRDIFVSSARKLLRETTLSGSDQIITEQLAFSALAVAEAANYGRSAPILGNRTLLSFVVAMHRLLVVRKYALVGNKNNILDQLEDLGLIGDRRNILLNILPSLFEQGRVEMAATINALYNMIYFMVVNLSQFDVWS